MTTPPHSSRRPWERTRAVIGPLLSPLYAAAVSRRNRRFDLGIGVKRVDVPVVSVGNLTTGGTGKTPMVMWLASQLHSRGKSVLIAMRGYKGHGDGSDEADEYRRRLPGVRVVVNPDRVAGIETALRERRVDVVLLDDGFQHRRLHRDVDIVLMDATRDLAAERLLPTGDLREPPVNIRRAHAVVLTHAERASPGDIERCRSQIASFLGPRRDDPIVTSASHEWRSIAAHDGALPVEWLSGKRVVAACGIGSPGHFMSQLNTRSTVIAAHVKPDHDPFDPGTVAAIVADARRLNAEAIVVTEKDWSKLARLSAETWPCPVVRPVLAMRIDDAGVLLGAVLRLVHPA